MGDKTRIAWADATWNPLSGCTKVSEGCRHCYIDRCPPFRMARRRFDREGIGATTGVQLHPERLDQPLRWRKARRIFVCSLADLFHDEVPDDYIAKVWAVMALARQHTFQVLTKRPARMRALLASREFHAAVDDASHDVNREAFLAGARSRPQFERTCDKWWRETAGRWPLPNVWVGVTAEDQPNADRRIPILLDTPAAVRFVSYEPAVGPLNLSDYIDRLCDDDCGTCDWGHCDRPAVSVRRDFTNDDDFYVSMLPVCDRHRGIDWVIAGGESGPGARPAHPDWFRSIRDQCVAAGVPFHFKQWGEWAPTSGVGVGPLTNSKRRVYGEPVDPASLGLRNAADLPWRAILERVGTRNAGHLLDGQEWMQFPDPEVLS